MTAAEYRRHVVAGSLWRAAIVWPFVATFSHWPTDVEDSRGPRALVDTLHLLVILAAGLAAYAFSPMLCVALAAGVYWWWNRSTPGPKNDMGAT